ncbi:MAG: hypothetical protein ABSG90_09205 [Dehalococcoidia bacterium]
MGTNLGAPILGPGPGIVNLQANDTFTVQVKPAIGSTITIQRQLPPVIDPVMDLH